MKTTIISCIRCGKTHKDLEMNKFTNPVLDKYNYWAICPTFTEPIIIEVTFEE